MMKRCTDPNLLLNLKSKLQQLLFRRCKPTRQRQDKDKGGMRKQEMRDTRQLDARRDVHLLSFHILRAIAMRRPHSGPAGMPCVERSYEADKDQDETGMHFR